MQNLNNKTPVLINNPDKEKLYYNDRNIWVNENMD